MSDNNRSWSKYFESRYEGLGTAYERFILHQYFERIRNRYCVESVIEVPCFGMTGISGINSLRWAVHGFRIGVVHNAEERVDLGKLVLREKRQVIPCFSGFASAQIAPGGDVCLCCINAEPIGNLRDTEYDFKKIWFSEKAKESRSRIKRGECYCPLANASYTNMLHNFKSLCRVGWNFVRVN